jgi:hypothetical protein
MNFVSCLAKTGGPEYACGVLCFPDFLEMKVSVAEGEEQAYFRECLKVNLHRQIGSRYFVTAANATKILFLNDAAIAFLKFTGKDRVGNKLEQDVFSKLHDSIELDHLKAGTITDLYMMSKSNDLVCPCYL